MKIYIFEKGFNYSQDGPGNRLVYHLSGCNMYCPWCSNPEGMTKGETAYDCDFIADEIISCMPMFFDYGGVTFTGGECTLQSEALCHILEKIKKNGINVCIESNAMSEKFYTVASECDHVIVDYKSPIKERLQKITGGNLGIIENNIRLLLKSKYLHIRIPLIHGFNDDEESLNGFVNFFRTLDGEFDVEILPYHEYGKEKWNKIGKEYTVTDGFIKQETKKVFTDSFISNGIKIIRT